MGSRGSEVVPPAPGKGGGERRAAPRWHLFDAPLERECGGKMDEAHWEKGKSGSERQRGRDLESKQFGLYLK